MVSQPAPKRMIPKSKYLAWAKRLHALNDQLPEDMTDAEWLGGGQEIRSLIVDLGTVGRAAGIVVPYAKDNPDGTIAFGETTVDDVDWEHGEIDFQASEYHWNDGIDRATGLIARLVKVTGIPE